MNGKYLLDTNAVINLLKDENATFKFKDKNGVYLASIITEIELLSFKNLTPEDETNIKKLLPQSCVVPLTQAIKEKTIEMKRSQNIKLPDAVICATALVKGLTLVTDDKGLLKITNLAVIQLSDFIDN